MESQLDYRAHMGSNPSSGSTRTVLRNRNIDHCHDIYR